MRNGLIKVVLLLACVISVFGQSGVSQYPGVAGATGAAGAAGLNNTPAGTLTAGNFNSTADQPITVSLPTGYTRYVVRRVIVSNASISLTLAAGGLYTAAAKGGSALVAAAQVYSALTSSTKFADCTLAAISGTDIQTAATLYFSLTVAQGAAATANVSIIVDYLP